LVLQAHKRFNNATPLRNLKPARTSKDDTGPAQPHNPAPHIFTRGKINRE